MDLQALTEGLASGHASRGDAETGAQTDMRFHEALAAATHNGLMPVLLGAMEAVLLGARRMAYGLPQTLDNALLHHRRILDAVERGDSTGARDAMRAHLEEAENTLRHAQESPRRRARFSAPVWPRRPTKLGVLVAARSGTGGAGPSAASTTTLFRCRRPSDRGRGVEPPPGGPCAR